MAHLPLRSVAPMKLWQRVREHWKGLCVVAVCFLALHVLPRSAVNAIVWAVLALVVVVFFVVPLVEIFAEKRLRRHVVSHIEARGYEVVEIKRWDSHFGVTFRAQGQKRSARFEHGGWGRVVDWLDGPP